MDIKLYDTLDTINKCIAATKGEIGVLWQEIGADKPMFEFAPDRRMASASLIKVPVMLALLEDVRAGKRRLNDVIRVESGCLLEDSEPFDRGARGATLEELLTWMIIVSDNTSTNALIDGIGMEKINAWCAGAGLRDTVLMRKMLDFGAIERGMNNYTSARDQFILFNNLTENKILTPGLCATALRIFKKQRSGDMLLRYIWEDAEVAHKTGGLDYLCHDAGIFFLPGVAYFLAVLLQGSDRINGDRRLAGGISRAAYDYYAETRREP